MLTIDIPGSGPLKMQHLVLDYNGTIALDGELLAGVSQRLETLSTMLRIHVITADTHGTVKEKLHALQLSVHIIGSENQDRAKREFVNELDANRVAAVGNGRNDVLMLEIAALGIGVVQTEGMAAGVVRGADVICTSILDAFDLLLFPDRLRATLRR